MALASELQRRQSNTEKVWALFQARPGQWIHWRRIAAIGGACAWRTRISDARMKTKSLGGVIEHNKSIKRSAYRYLPHVPLGRDPQTPATDRWPVFGAPAYEEVWKLT